MTSKAIKINIKMLGHHRGTRRSAAVTILITALLSISTYHIASASAIAPPLAARLATKQKTQKVNAAEPSAPSQLESPLGGAMSSNSAAATKKSAASNPIVQLVTYVKTSMVTFKNGLGQMNLDHRRCNDIRAKQRTFAEGNGFKRPRGMKGIQTGGISYGGETSYITNIFYVIYFIILCSCSLISFIHNNIQNTTS